MNQHDWNKYREEFPARYWQHGIFDEKLLDILKELHPQYKFQSALDVGGGVLGTLVLKDFSETYGIDVDLLDPFISKKPDWIREQVNWDNNNQYDLIIARGSINYLTVEQLSKLKELLSPNGVLIANTFLNAPSKDWSEREAINMNGEKGIERSRLNGNIIEHQIIFSNYKHEHTFYYYSLDDYQKVWGEIKAENYAKNSSLIFFKKTYLY